MAPQLLAVISRRTIIIAGGEFKSPTQISGLLSNDESGSIRVSTVRREDLHRLDGVKISKDYFELHSVSVRRPLSLVQGDIRLLTQKEIELFGNGPSKW